MTTDVKTITLDEAERNKSSALYILNRIIPAGNINFEVITASGNKQMVRLPITWIPFDVTTQAAKSAVLASSDFRRLYQGRKIFIVDGKSAEEVLKNPDAAAEAARLYNITDEQSQGGESLRISPISNGIQDAEMKRALAEAATGELGGASPFAFNIVNAKDLSEDKAIAMLRGNIHTLNADDLQYIADNSTQPRVKEVAAEAMGR